jgi:hypothetical protein
MAKFLNQKEQVIDFKLTDYGHYLLSIGSLEPVYYAFFDDNILYDSQYAGFSEGQSSTQPRIQNETQYIETLTLFTDIDSQLLQNETGASTDVTRVRDAAVGDPGFGTSRNNLFFAADITPTMTRPSTENLRFSSMIGNAALDGNTQHAPAWKVVALQGQVSSSTDVDSKNDIRIPQVNMDLNYSLKVLPDISFDVAWPDAVREAQSVISGFVDGNSIGLVLDDALIYCEEANTQLFTENFDIEVFMIESGSANDSFIRKYFEKTKPQIINNLLVSERPEQRLLSELTTGSVEYYFDILKDYEIDRETACRGSALFNKSSYYVDLDFDCAQTQEDEVMLIDIYGRVTESEICPT